MTIRQRLHLKYLILLLFLLLLLLLYTSITTDTTFILSRIIVTIILGKHLNKPIRSNLLVDIGTRSFSSISPILKLSDARDGYRTCNVASVFESNTYFDLIL